MKKINLNYILMAIISNLLVVCIIISFMMIGKQVDLIELKYNERESTLNVESDLLNMQSGSRGYFITKNKDFLESYWYGKNSFSYSIRDSYNNSSGNPNRQNDLKKIELLEGEWITLVEGTIINGNDGSKVQNVVGLFNKRKIVFDQIVTLLTKIKLEEKYSIHAVTEQRNSCMRYFVILLVFSAGIINHYSYYINNKNNLLEQENKSLKKIGKDLSNPL